MVEYVCPGRSYDQKTFDVDHPCTPEKLLSGFILAPALCVLLAKTLKISQLKQGITKEGKWRYLAFSFLSFEKKHL